MRGNGIMSIAQIVTRSALQAELRRHRMMASVITHKLAAMPDDIPDDIPDEEQEVLEELEMRAYVKDWVNNRHFDKEE